MSFNIFTKFIIIIIINLSFIRMAQIPVFSRMSYLIIVCASQFPFNMYQYLEFERFMLMNKPENVM